MKDRPYKNPFEEMISEDIILTGGESTIQWRNSLSPRFFIWYFWYLLLLVVFMYLVLSVSFDAILKLKLALIKVTGSLKSVPPPSNAKKENKTKSRGFYNSAGFKQRSNRAWSQVAIDSSIYSTLAIIWIFFPRCKLTSDPQLRFAKKWKDLFLMYWNNLFKWLLELPWNFDESQLLFVPFL